LKKRKDELDIKEFKIKISIDIINKKLSVQKQQSILIKKKIDFLNNNLIVIFKMIKKIKIEI